jgi:hypothetical protein
MAGDWIAWVKGLSRRREVVIIAATLDITPREAAACCMEWWEWCDAEGDFDDVRNCSVKCLDFVRGLSLIDSVIGLPGFGKAMADVGWAVANDAGELMHPGLGRWTGSTGRERLKDRQRKAENRDLSGKCPENVRTQTGPREEKRREENRRLRQTSVADGDGDMNVWVRAKEYANRELKPKLGNKSKADQNTALKVAYLHVTGRIPESAVAESLDFGVVAKPWAIFTVRFKERVGGPAKFKQLLASVNVPAHIPAATADEVVTTGIGKAVPQ